MTPDKNAAQAGTWLRSENSEMATGQKYASLVAVLLLIVAALFTLREFLPALAWTVIFAIALWPLFQRAAASWPRHQRELLPGLFVLAVVLVFVIPVILIAVPLAADAYGDCITHARGHYECWQEWQGLGGTRLVAKGYPTKIASTEYDE